MRTLRTAAVLAIIGAVALSAAVVDGNPALGPVPTTQADAQRLGGAPRLPGDPAMRIARLPFAWSAPPIDLPLPPALPATLPWLLPEPLQALSADDRRVTRLAAPTAWASDLDMARLPDDPTWPRSLGLPDLVAWALQNNDNASFEQVANSSWQLRPADGTTQGAVGGNPTLALNGLLLTQTAAVPEPGTGVLWALGLLLVLLALRPGAGGDSRSHPGAQSRPLPSHGRHHTL